MSCAAYTASLPEGPVGASGSSRWVLVVDDDDDLRDVTVDTLEYAGYRVLGVASGELALAAIHDSPFLVLADLRMPRMDGLQLLRAMQAELGARVPPVVFLTGASTSMTGHLDAPVLSKPVDVDELLNMVARHCPHELLGGDPRPAGNGHHKTGQLM